MKVKILFIGCILLFSYFTVSAQKSIYVIPKVGLNISTITNVDSDWDYGMNIGCGLEWKVKPEFAVESGLFFSQMGTKKLIEDKNTRKKDIGINYIQIPIAAKYYLYRGLNMFAGPQLGYRVNYTHTPYVEVVSFDEKKIDFSCIIGLEYKFKIGLLFSANYVTGITNLEHTLEQNNIDAPVKYEKSNNRNSAFQFNIGWSF